MKAILTIGRLLSVVVLAAAIPSCGAPSITSGAHEQAREEAQPPKEKRFCSGVPNWEAARTCFLREIHKEQRETNRLLRALCESAYPTCGYKYRQERERQEGGDD